MEKEDDGTQKNERKRKMKIGNKIEYIGLAGLLLSSCANMGSGPTGGLKDEIPPKYMSSIPSPNTKNCHLQKVTLTFDEYINLKDPYTQILVSPPQSKTPNITSMGKKVEVQLQDSLQPNTTYVIDFGNSIADNNEGNILKDYSFSFSTGNELDSFYIQGTLLWADDLSPVEGALVGAYESADPKAFQTRKFEKVGKTGKGGHFYLRGLANKSYTLYALNESNNNYYFDDKSEGIAQLGENILPQRIKEEKKDTVWKHTSAEDTTLIVDTIKSREIYTFKPNDLVLKMYNETLHHQYYKNASRKTRGKLSLYFHNEKDNLPTITPLNFTAKDWYLCEPSVTRDTFDYWITDTAVYRQDTLRFAIDYQKTDSAGNFIATRDTVELLPKKWSHKKKDENVDLTVNNIIEIYESPIIQWSTPIYNIDNAFIKLQTKKAKDTTWTDLHAALVPVADQPRNYRLGFTPIPEAEYKLTVDTNKMTDIFGAKNKEKITKRFRYRKPEEYTAMNFNLIGLTTPAYVELVNTKDQVVRKVPVLNNQVKMEYLHPGEYYARLIEDVNRDDGWTTGNYETGAKPENVYYYPTLLKLRANWDRTEDWNLHTTPTTQQRSSVLPTNLHNKKKK